MQTVEACLSIVLGLLIGIAAGLAMIKYAYGLLAAFCIISPFVLGHYAIFYVFERGES